MGQPLQIGILGCGNFSSTAHKLVLEKLQNQALINVVSVCDLDPQRAKPYGHSLQAKPFTGALEFFAQSEIQGVALFPPVGKAAEFINLAVQHQLPFMVEKPTAQNQSEHKALMQKAKNIPHLVAYNRRFAPYATKARTWIETFPISKVQAKFTRKGRTDFDFSATAIHAIDAIRFLSGQDFEAVTLKGQTNMHLTGNLISGAEVDLTVMPTADKTEERYIVYGTNQKVEILFPAAQRKDYPGYVAWFQNDHCKEKCSAWEFKIDPNDRFAINGLEFEHRAFLEVITSQASSPCNLASTLQTQEIRDGYQKASATGEPIHLTWPKCHLI